MKKVSNISKLYVLGTLLPALLSVLFATGCGEPCCPEIKEFKSQFEWVCNCPDAGTRLFYTIAFLKEGKPCASTDPVGLMQLKNITENTAPAGNNFIEVSSGIFQNPSGGTYMELHQTSEIKLTATGDSVCRAATKVITVEVVKAGSSHQLCFSHNGEPVPVGFWQGTTNIFGPRIVIDKVVNPQNFAINVTHKGITAMNLQPGADTPIHSGQDPNGKWTLEIPDSGTYNEFLLKGDKLCVEVYLKCDC